MEVFLEAPMMPYLQYGLAHLTSVPYAFPYHLRFIHDRATLGPHNCAMLQQQIADKLLTVNTLKLVPLPQCARMGTSGQAVESPMLTTST